MGLNWIKCYTFYSWKIFKTTKLKFIPALFQTSINSNMAFQSLHLQCQGFKQADTCLLSQKRICCKWKYYSLFKLFDQFISKIKPAWLSPVSAVH